METDDGSSVLSDHNADGFICRVSFCSGHQWALDGPAEGVHQGDDLLPGQLETFGGAMFWKLLDLPLREQDLQSRPQTLSLHTHAHTLMKEN